MAGASWRLLGSQRAADTLLDAMSSDDEQSRMLAGMSLVKAGQRSFDLIKSKIEAGEASAGVIRLLPDIGGEKARDVLNAVATHGPADLVHAAVECIDLLDRIDRLED